MNDSALIELRKLFVDPRSDAEPKPGQIGVSHAMRIAEGVDKRERTIKAHVATTDVARDGMVIVSDAWREWLPTFERNPVMSAGHRHIGPAGEPTAIGFWSELDIKEDGLHATGKFSTTPLAKDYLTLYGDGSMRMFSVSWITHKRVF